MIMMLTLHATSFTTPSPKAALLQPLSPGAKLQQCSGLLLGSALLQDERAWELLQTEDACRFSEIAQATRTAPSPRHQLGLFANVDLAKDTVASFYPVHSFGLEAQRLASNNDQEYWVDCSPAYRAPMLHEAVQAFAPGTYVDVNLQRAELAGWCAHRANDASVCTGASEAEILAYLTACEAECNCVLVPFGGAAPILALFTTRAIQKDEEVKWTQRLDLGTRLCIAIDCLMPQPTLTCRCPCRLANSSAARESRPRVLARAARRRRCGCRHDAGSRECICELAWGVYPRRQPRKADGALPAGNRDLRRHDCAGRGRHGGERGREGGGGASGPTDCSGARAGSKASHSLPQAEEEEDLWEDQEEAIDSA